MDDAAKKQSLKLQLHEARGQVQGNIAGIRRDFSFGRRFRQSVRQKPVAWYAGAAVLGLLLALIPRMGRKVVVTRTVSADKQAGKAAALLAAAKIALDFGKPTILAWIRNRAENRPIRPKAPRSRPAPVSSRFR